jgi:hypothetical protein
MQKQKDELTREKNYEEKEDGRGEREMEEIWGKGKEKNDWKLNRDIWCPGRDSNQTLLNVRHTRYHPRQHDVQYSNNLHISISFSVLYGCESWSLTLREGHRLRVFGNRVLRRIFGPKRDEVTGGWRKLHNEELHNLYSSPSIIRMIKSRKMRWTGHVARMETRGMRIGYWWESQNERYY